VAHTSARKSKVESGKAVATCRRRSTATAIFGATQSSRPTKRNANISRAGARNALAFVPLPVYGILLGYGSSIVAARDSLTCRRELAENYETRRLSGRVKDRRIFSWTITRARA